MRRAFGTERAVDGVDLDVRSGEIHALVGLNGAGKSTLMRLLLGLQRPDAGRALVRHAGALRDVGEVRPEAFGQVGHLVETPFTYAELTVREVVRSAARLRGLGRAAADRATRGVLAELALERWADRRSRTLSLGNRQRVGLACALVHEPTVLVLDEPSNALDPAGVVLVRRRLRRAADAGAAVLVSSHHLDEMARMADRITVLHRGVVVGSLPPGGVDLERQLFAMVAAADGVPTEEALG
ncbi:MAG: ABC transporter ATP-binding protein [Actinotalea sp.]|nr:ABC transporter ATP-binding protein [Actinotalea sp.]